MLYAGRGYFYFGSVSGAVSIANRFKDTAVMVNRLNALSPDDWLAEFKTKADAVSESVVDRIDAVLGRLEEKRGLWLFHTTSFSSLDDILRAGHLKPKDNGGYISFSEKPHFSDISGKDVVLVFDRRAVLPFVEQVSYDEEWFDAHNEQALYIAGEGWREQYTAPDYDQFSDYDPDDEVWEPDPDEEAAFERDAALQAFLDKSDEREWVSKSSRTIPLTGLQRVIVANPAAMDRARDIVVDLGFTGPIMPMATARREYAKS